MRLHDYRARPRRRARPVGAGDRLTGAVAPNMLDRQFTATRPNEKRIADFT
jgi:putative transposase